MIIIGPVISGCGANFWRRFADIFSRVAGFCSDFGRIGGKLALKKTLFFTFCDDFLLFCEKSKKITAFNGKLTGAKRGFVDFWGLNGDFLFFGVNFS